MSKKIIYPICILSSIAVLGLTSIAASRSANADTSSHQDGLLALNNSAVLSDAKIGDTKNETVYLMSGTDGKINNTYIGSTLYTGSANLPFNLKISYYLDGQAISAQDLADQTGHVKIIYDYEATTTFQNKKVPFVAITGLELDGTKFRNVKVENGKIINTGNSYTVAGTTVLGLNENFGTDVLPESFVVEADVSDFALGTVYTVLLNDVIADLDTTKLSSVDSVVSSINQLADGVDQLTAGANTLAQGAQKLSSGAKELDAGTTKLAVGIASAKAGADKLSGGLTEITSNNAVLELGAKAIVSSTLQSLNVNPTVQYALSQMGVESITNENYATLISTILKMQDSDELKQAMSLLDFANGVLKYTNGVAEAAAGASDLATGLDTINGKMSELTLGTSTLASGADELYGGTIKLSDGLNTFSSQGINRLVDFVNRDLAGFTNNLRQSVSAARSYKHFVSPNAESVKFIVKTASIK